MPQGPQTGNLPLDGIRVLDLGTMVGGPYAGTLLGDFGAEVIKLELPGSGDPARELGIANPKNPQRSLWWLSLSRGKLSATLDVRQPEGRELFLRLVAQSDVVVENYRPGTMEKWGLGFADLRAVNPGIILMRTSGFGQTGPRSPLPGFDRAVQAYAGATYITGFPDGAPVRSAIPLGDYGGAIFGCLGVLMALYYRDARGTGQGQVVDIALYEPMIAQSMDIIPAYDLLGIVTGRHGNRYPTLAPGDVYATQDGRWLMLSANSQVMFARLARAMGQPELVDDARFCTNAQRLAHREDIEGRVAAWVGSLPLASIMAICDREALPASPVNSVADFIDDEHMQERGSIVAVDDPELPGVRLPGVFPRLTLTPGHIASAAPALGQHNDYVHEQLLGLSTAQREQLQARGVI